MSSLWNEFRLALRSLRRAPLYSTLAILTAAVGIGASTAIYSVARPIIFESAPYRAPDKLVYVWERAQDGTSSNIGFPTDQDFARDVHSFSNSAVMSFWQITLASEGVAERVFGQRVSVNYFNTLGVRPFLGRDFRPEEDTYATRRVIMLTHGLWKRRFGGDSTLPGKTIDVSGYQYVVAGVLPEGFENLTAPQAEVVDMSLAVTRARPMSDFIDLAMAQRRFVLKLLAVFAAVALVLVTAGLYGVTAAGVAERRREIGLRAALGATQARILSTVLSRSATLVGAGVGLGVVGALLLNKTLQAMLFGVSPSDPLTIGAVIGVLLFVAALASMIPARRAVSVDPAITLRDE